MAEGRTRPVWAEVDLDALGANVALLAHRAAPAALCAVVKADAYGHGAVQVARTAVESGAAGLAVALVDEGLELREHAISAPVLVLSEVVPDAAEVLVRGGLTATVSTQAGMEALSQAARRVGTRAGIHVKVDTGMHRVGVAEAEAVGLVDAAAADPALRVEAVWTHLAVADGATDEDRAFTTLQLERFDKVVAGLGARPRLVHAANTAAAVAWPSARYDLVRCGIGMYGYAPSPAMSDGGAGPDVAGFFAELRPVLSLKARVSAVRELDAGERPSYGRRRPLPERGVVATVPIGYADGVSRRLFDAGCPVLIGGRRRPLAGVVTMDQIVVDCGPASPVAPGDEVTLIGRQDGEEITAADWAARLGTIAYEVLCGVGTRVPRVYAGAGSR
ncbi:MAG TPA: alanine racemase [Acidimicrobiales bacterium]|nr:alanine racemase [Acidimicrobiales bacterium]